MNDWIFFVGGMIFVALGAVSYINADLLWRIYSLEPRWHRHNPDKPEDWTARARKHGFYFLIIGAIFVVLGY
jgi:hypothetical protein